MSDQIKIQNLEVFGFHGVFPEEKKLGQKFLLDAVLHTSTRQAGLTDDLNKSIDYGEVCHFLTDLMQQKTFQLLESVAERMAEALLLKWNIIEKVELEIKKPWAPIGLPIETVAVRISRSRHRVYLSIGSNMGDRRNYLDQAVEKLKAHRAICNVRTSEWIETAAYGLTDQPDFLNGAIELDTLLPPYELLDLLHEIEAEAGRERKIHWGPRTLDLDILFYDNEIMEQPELIVPHADMSNRMFVLEPLAQLCPGKLHPVYHKTVLQMKQELKQK